MRGPPVIIHFRLASYWGTLIFSTQTEIRGRSWLSWRLSWAGSWAAMSSAWRLQSVEDRFAVFKTSVDDDSSLYYIGYASGILGGTGSMLQLDVVPIICGNPPPNQAV